MARMRQPVLSPDLFGDKARGVSLPDITWETYAEIVRISGKKFSKLLRRMTPGVLKKLIDRRNWNSGSTISFIARKSLFVTVLVTEVQKNTVTVNLSLDDLADLKISAEIMNALLRDLVAETRCLDLLTVKNGVLVGQVMLSAKILTLQRRKLGVRQDTWPKESLSIDAELKFMDEQKAGRIAR